MWSDLYAHFYLRYQCAKWEGEGGEGSYKLRWICRSAGWRKTTIPKSHDSPWSFFIFFFYLFFSSSAPLLPFLCLSLRCCCRRHRKPWPHPKNVSRRIDTEWDSRHLSFDITAHSHLQCSAGSAGRGDRRENSFSAPTEGQVAAGGAAVVGRIGLLEGRKRENDLFLFFFFFWQGKGSLSPTERESHSSRAESNSCARYHSLCSCTRQQQSAAVSSDDDYSREPTVTRSP